MRAMVLDRPGAVEDAPLREAEIRVPVAGPGEVLARVLACGVCRTDLHVIEGELAARALAPSGTVAELAHPKMPVVPGHQIVGEVEAVGDGVDGLAPGDRVGAGWLRGTCGSCGYCRTGRENLCDRAEFTGYTADGGYAERAVLPASFAFTIPPGYSDVEAAPLLCAGLIGYRALRLAEVEGLDGPGRLGLYGFGASAHIVIQVARHRGHEVYVFTREQGGRELARGLGAEWTGAGREAPPRPLDSAIIFAPAGVLVPAALAALRKGGVLVLAGIHMSPVPELPYELLWGERVVRSVANLTRRDGEEFLALAPRVPVSTTVTPFPLGEANRALRELKSGLFEGAAVLVP